MADYDTDIDYYEVLQVHPRAHQEVIKRAYRTIVGLLQTHPDLGGSHDQAVRINEAYQVLSDPAARQAYDLARRRQSVCTGLSPAAEYARHARTSSTYQASAAAPAPSPPSAEASSRVSAQTRYCPRCGARNRLPEGADLRQAICGKCHAPLQRGPAALEGAMTGMKLSAEQAERLARLGELRLQRHQLPTDGRLDCWRCHHEWVTAPSAALPAACPRCGNRHWSEFRIFRCRHCSHQFISGALATFPWLWWPWPYWLFAACPACHRLHWHQGCEGTTWQMLLRKLLRHT